MIQHFPRVLALILVLRGLAGVSAYAAKEQWISVSSPHFTVLTPARPEVARDWAIELERFRLLLQQVVAVPESLLRPVTVVLFATDKDLRPYKPLVNGKPKDVSGLFVNFGDSHAIELSLDGNTAKTRRVIFHEVVHWYSSAGSGEVPLWLEEGVAEVYSTFRATRDGKCSFGNVITDHLKFLRSHPQWSMERLASTTEDSPDYNEGDRASQFYAASWLAVHYLLFGSDAPGQAAIARYLDVRGRGVPAKAAFTQAFGSDYAGFKARLVTYLAKGEHLVRTYQDTNLQLEQGLISRPATEAEVQLALATLLIGARPNNAADAVPRLERAAALDPGNPVVWQVLGEKAVMEKRYDEAAGHFAKSAAAGSASYYVYFGLGNCRKRKISGEPDEIDSVAAGESAKDFRRALALNPRYIPAYEGLAGLMFAVKTPDPEDRPLLEAGARLAPDSLMIDVGLASCDLRGGRREAGRRRLQLVLDTPSGSQPEARKLAAEIILIDDWNLLSETLNDLFQRGRYGDAVTLIDSVREKFSGPQFRATLEQNRLEAEGFRLVNQAIDTANAGDNATARNLLRQILDSDVSANAKREATRVLEVIAADHPLKSGKN